MIKTVVTHVELSSDITCGLIYSMKCAMLDAHRRCHAAITASNQACMRKQWAVCWKHHRAPAHLTRVLLTLRTLFYPGHSQSVTGATKRLKGVQLLQLQPSFGIGTSTVGMLSRGIQRGSSLLWGQLGAPAAQARCVGNASKLFPDGSAVQGDAYPSERGEFGQVSGMPMEVAGRTVGHTLPPVISCTVRVVCIAAAEHVLQCTHEHARPCCMRTQRQQQCSCEQLACGPTGVHLCTSTHS